MNEKIINKRIYNDYKYLKTLNYEVLGVFLQGSQNYKCDYENSDIDTKAIVLPSMEDIILNKKPESTTIVLPSNEHIDIKDIRLMHDCFKKQNINFIEILFTKYRYINPEYFELYRPMFDNNEKIAHYNNYAAINCIVGMVYEKYKALEHPYPATKDKIDKYGFDPKQLSHILRCEEFLTRYINGESYEQCLIPTRRDLLIRIKANCPYNLCQARGIAKFFNEKAKRIKDKYMEDNPIIIDKTVDKIMNNVLCNVFKYNFSKSIGDINHN